MTRPSEQSLFAALDATWPAARFVDTGPWRLREGLGGGQRVSAATPISDFEPADLELAEEGMRKLGQQPLFMVRGVDRALDDTLADRGYAVVDPVTLYVAEAASLAGDIPHALAYTSWPPLAIQLEIWAAAGVGPRRIAVMERTEAPKAAILGRSGERPAGTAFVAGHGDVVMLHALEVDPGMRRSGVGNRIMRAAANWAISVGARWLTLAVTRANDPANALYRGLGMETVTEYHYRRAPETAA